MEVHVECFFCWGEMEGLFGEAKIAQRRQGFWAEEGGSEVRRLRRRFIFREQLLLLIPRRGKHRPAAWRHVKTLQLSSSYSPSSLTL